MKVSDDPEVVLATYSLGSCIGVLIYDTGARVGGVLHYMLPESSLAPEKAKKNPFMFADTGIPLLFHHAYELGAVKSRLAVKVVGGARILNDGGLFNIGKRNELMLRKMFWRNNMMVDAEAVGGSVNRTVRLHIGSGKVILREAGRERQL
jgi:chemotaxis protein CheD